MAPRKRAATAEPSTRVTRSSTRVAKPAAPEESSPLKKKPKAAAAIEKKPKEKKPKVSSSPPVFLEEKEKEEKIAEKKAKEKLAAVVDGGSKKTIVVEHCKQCNSFKTRALLVKEGLEKARFNVVLNPEKPRRGCFEIREERENGEIFISLLDMKRPFAPMKALDMDKVVSDVLDKLQK